MSGEVRSLLRAGGVAPVGLNLLVLVLGTAAALHASNADLYYRSVQEDEWLEWASFWSFLLAAGVHLAAAAARFGRGERLPWFPLAVAAASALVAFEEISWGQLRRRRAAPARLLPR